MKIIISPAKKMVTDDGLAWKALPVFLEQAEELKETIQRLPYEEAKALWKCNDQIAKLNYERFAQMELRQNLTPAILSYEGIQYRYMAPGVFTQDCLDYIQGHLFILSGFYGVLRPFDGITPYRLEMQAKLVTSGHEDLYGFWGSALAKALEQETDTIIDLASKEYSKAVSAHLSPSTRLIGCIFAQQAGDKLAEKGTLCKMARGEMVRFLAERQAGSPEDLKSFDRLGFRFSPEHSEKDKYVFIKE